MSEKTLLIIGAGGHGKAVAEAALLSGEWQRVAFADDRYPELRETFGWPVVAEVAGLAALEIQVAGAIAAVGNNAVREQWVAAIRAASAVLRTTTRSTRGKLLSSQALHCPNGCSCE